jgi:hypothetical protein
MAETRELRITSNGYQCMVDVSASDTFASVRTKIQDEFDADMLPSQDFTISVSGLRLSRKQEARKSAWDVANSQGQGKSGAAVHLQAKGKRPAEELAAASSGNDKNYNSDNGVSPVKKIRTVSENEDPEVARITPIIQDSPAAAGVAEDVSIHDPSIPDTPPVDKAVEEMDETPDDEDVEVSGANHKNDDDDDEISITRMAALPENPNTKFDEAVASSRDLLRKLMNVLDQPENEIFCVQSRRREWKAELANSLKQTAPDTIIGVLGNTGVGKSSLLNALLDEANVLPTSGSRGCTAAVVELRFNTALKETQPGTETTVYKGQVEFIKLQDWLDELQVLIDEVSTHDTKLIYIMKPDESRQPDAAAAWAKINQVYGEGTLESYQGQPKDRVWQRLSSNRRVVQLLQSDNGEPKTIEVEEGTADEMQCKMLCNPLSMLRGRLRRTQKKWAGNFRNKINDYVYRKGNGNAPQTWPLIRRVVVYGPWAVLSTGACLVDLPGVRDANAARARVAQNYLQNCNMVAVVAPIQRAVDDGTAKELMGENFKRRLLMDGNYGNVMFICTQTDSCEATEILRDHADVAQRVPGRFEKMTKLQDDIISMSKEVGDLLREEDDLKVEMEELNDEIKDLKADIKELKKEMTSADDDFDEVAVDNAQTLEALERSLAEKKQRVAKCQKKIDSEPLKGKREMADSIQNSLGTKQRSLKAKAAMVRNEYSTECLQKDFKAGLEELINGDDDGERNITPLPDDYELEVHCICSNDYLKLQGIKSATDGKAGTFSHPDETNIPSLRQAVFTATARFRESFATTFVESASDMLDRFHLCATQDKEETGSGIRFSRLFEHELKGLDQLMEPIVSRFIREAEGKVNTALKPSLSSGAKQGTTAAMGTVTSWGSKNRRNRHLRSPDANGLYWSTYYATVRRDGVYTSGSAGPIDMNQELCDPMEKEFSAEWQQIMDGALTGFLRDAEKSVTSAFTNIAQALVNAFAEGGMERTRLQTMGNTANRTCTTAIRVAFEGMRKVASDSQRELNRSLLPAVKNNMRGGYQAAVHTPGGTGRFQRIKDAMHDHASIAVKTMFSDATQELLAAIASLIKQLARKIMGMSEVINKSLASVYSVCWDDQQVKQQIIDPDMLEKIRACRNRLIPTLVEFRNDHDAVLLSLGIERDDVELDIVGVESWETRKAREMEEAKATGNYIELLDSDDEDECLNRKPAAVQSKPPVRIKADSGAP